jgi:hypothetical protein
MGNRASSTNEVVIDVSTALSVVTNLIQTNSQSIAQTGTNTNIFTLETAEGSVVRAKSITSTQNIDTTVQASGEVSAEIRNKIGVDMKSALDAAVDQSSTASTGIFAFGDSTSTVNKTKSKNAISASIDTVAKQDNWQTIVSSVVNKNEGKIYLRGNVQVDEGIVNDQRLVSRLIAKAVLNTVLDNANQILTDNKTNLKITQKADSKTGLFGGTGGMIGSVISMVALCCICLIVLIIIMKLKGGGKSE